MSGEGKLSGIITNPNSETAGMGHQMNFNSIYSHGFARVAASTIVSSVANPTANVAAILDAAKECHEKSVTVALFPELCVSGYAIEDLLLQDALLDATERAVATIIEASVGFMTVLVFGAPLRNGSRIYNCAIVVHRGRVLGVVPKTYLPTYREFYEARHFGSGRDADCLEISIGSMRAPFGTDLLFEADDVPGLVVGVEICEDMWIPVTPGSELALAGAIVLLNLSGSPITIGRARSRALLCQSTSARCLAAYVYAAGGAGESTTDLAWDGQKLPLRISISTYCDRNAPPWALSMITVQIEGTEIPTETFGSQLNLQTRT